MADLEGLVIDTVRGSAQDAYYYEVKRADGPGQKYGRTYDSDNAFSDMDDFEPSPVAIDVASDAGQRAVHAGDFVTLKYDGSRTLDVYFPEITGYGITTLYIGKDGSTYTDSLLCDLAQGAPWSAKLALLVSQNAGDLNIYFWNSPARGDWTYWSCHSRNPSPMARDLWQIPTGNDGVGITSIDIAGSTDSTDELALLVSQNGGDLNIYFWNSPDRGDWTYWDALSRNPSPLARDMWQIPIGNDAVGITSIDISEPVDNQKELGLLVSENVSDLNIYFWNAPVEGDLTYWDAAARNPSPLARDLWQIPTGNTAVGMTSVNITDDGKDELALLVQQGAGDLNIYFWNAPVAGDWSYWDCFSRNPSPLARDLWQIPIGNDAVGLASVDLDGDESKELGILVQEGSGDLNIYFWNAPVAGDWTYWDCFSRNPSPLARDLWQIPIGNDAVGMTDIDM